MAWRRPATWVGRGGRRCAGARPAWTERFGNPCGVVFDGSGALYTADINNTIRKLVLASGAVTTVAGTAGAGGSSDGVGAAARFDGPQNVALDGAGSLLVADRGNHTLRKIVLATGAVTTVAGMAGSARWMAPAAPRALTWKPAWLPTDRATCTWRIR